jgi:hypothetical protein
MLLTECYFGDQIGVTWWVWHAAFGWGIEKCIQLLGGGNCSERDHSEDLGIDVVILKWILNK